MTRTRILLHCAAAAAATFAVSWLQIRPLGIFFIILLILWIYKTKCSASIEISSPPEITAYLARVLEQFTNLRKEKPAVFCLILSGALGILAIIGHIVSGSNVVLLGLVLSALLSTKYNFKIVQAPKKPSCPWTEVADNEVDEFLPEVNESNLFVLQRASDQAALPSQPGEDDEKNDEVPSELLIPDPIPEIDEKSDTSSEDELIIRPPAEDSQPMEFKKGYFKKDSSISTSSSSDEESLSKGLKFPDHSQVDSKEPKQQSHAAALMSASMGSNLSALSLVTGFVSWTAANQPKNKPLSTVKHETTAPSEQHHAEESSDESDFEVISPEDLNNP